jgi:hypothetical protein
MQDSNYEPNQVWKGDLQPMWPEALRSRLAKSLWNQGTSEMAFSESPLSLGPFINSFIMICETILGFHYGIVETLNWVITIYE